MLDALVVGKSQISIYRVPGSRFEGRLRAGRQVQKRLSMDSSIWFWICCHCLRQLVSNHGKRQIVSSVSSHGAQNLRHVEVVLLRLEFIEGSLIFTMASFFSVFCYLSNRLFFPKNLKIAALLQSSCRTTC